MRRLVRLLVLASLLSCAAFLRAQSVRWEPDGGSLALGQTSRLQLIFEGCAPKGRPSLPTVDGLQLQHLGQSSQTSIVNNVVSRSETLGYAVRPTSRNDVVIPEFSVETDKGKLTVPSVRFSIGAATVGNEGSLESISNSKFTVPESVWAGEVFPIEYALNVRERNVPNPQHLLGSLLDWKPAPLAIEDWTKPAGRESVVNGEQFITVFQTSRGTIAKPGTVTLNEGTQLINIAKGVDFFGQMMMDQFAITSNRPTINVRPLPGNAPASFNGAVGQFTLKSNVVPATAGVGEPITWTLTLNGSGNWPDIPGLPARQVSKDFRTVQPQAKRTPKEGKLFDATLVEDVVLIPTKPGSYALGPITWSYFDPAKGEYRIITTERTTITVTAPAAAPATPSEAAAAQSTAGAGAEKSAAAAKPRSIPRDPITSEKICPVPLDARSLGLGLLVPVIALVLFWLWLALRRARETDPLRARREARERIVETLAALRSTSDRERIVVLLQNWQHDSAILWQLPHAVPAPASFPAEAKVWSGLWSESDRTLYRPGTPLPADWINRAEAALAAQPVRAFSVFQLFHPRNLFPFAAMLCLGLAFAPAQTRADEASQAYWKADFTGAEKSWREQAAAEPTRFSAHYNLSLALAQQDRWSEAAAHAAAAFAQQPREPAVYWNLGFLSERAGFAPSVFTGFAKSHPPHVVARQLSPTHWQYALIGSVAIICLAGALLLLRLYAPEHTWLKATGISLLSLGIVLAALSLLSLRVYSPINDARAAIVWRTTILRSIPTEADSNQKTSPLAAGAVAIIDRGFLPNDLWVRLSFPNGQTGWVRKEDLVSIWGR